MRLSSDAKTWARVHFFRISTAALTLALLGWCFFFVPELLTWWLRATMQAIELTTGLLPYPWNDRAEIAVKALGGSFWFSITSAIIAVRLAFWLIATSWRRRDRSFSESFSPRSSSRPLPPELIASLLASRKAPDERERRV